MIRVLLADDHAIVRAGLRALLHAEPDIRVVAEASDGLEALAQLERHTPDALLVDLSMPNLNGVEVIQRARALAPSTRILVLSMHGSAEYVGPALRAGAHGYMVKGAGLQDLVRAVRAVSRGEGFFDPRAEAVASDLSRLTDGLAGLTPREREVLQMVAEGRTNREMAQRLGLSPKTVDSHRARLMRKLDLHDAQSVTRFAVRHGLVSE